MNSYCLAIFITTVIFGFFNAKLVFYSLTTLALTYVFWLFNKLTNVEFIVIFILFCSLTALLNIKFLRVKFLTKHFYKYLHSTDNNWSQFTRIDNGWLASDIERSIFQGRPSFAKLKPSSSKLDDSIIDNIQQTIAKQKTNNTILNALSKFGYLALNGKFAADDNNLSPQYLSMVLRNTAKIDPVLASALALYNLESVIGLIYRFGSKKQKEKYTQSFISGKLIPFLSPTTLFETLENQKTTIEGRVESQQLKNKETIGIRVSFKDLILLGISQSNCFHININIKDFNNVLGQTTHLGTAVCIVDKSIKGLQFKKGHKAYDNYFSYFSCTGDNLFLPMDHILAEEKGLGKGLEFVFRNHCHASNIWPLAVSIPTHNLSTLTGWYFAHLQKQNGRQLLSYKVVTSKLNEQFSLALKFKLLNKIALSNNLNPQTLKFSSLLLKNSSINATVDRLSLLREILGSNAHNIKQESKLRKFYKVSQLSTELDGMSHEINQLPLIKKAALACHPYYNDEVTALLNSDHKKGINDFDFHVFKHLGYIFHNLCKSWFYSFKTSFMLRFFFKKSKYKDMIKRLSANFAFITDVSLLRWTMKSKVNTSFASYIGESMINMTQAIVLSQHFDNKTNSGTEKKLTKSTLKNTLYEIQQSIKENINLAFGKPAAVFLKFLVFPFGRPFHAIKMYQSLDDEIDQICKSEDDKTAPITRYSPFLDKIYQAKIDLSKSEVAETAVTNATGTAITTDNYELLINRCLAAGILSIEQSENLRKAYQQILDIQLTNHFGSIHEKK